MILKRIITLIISAILFLNVFYVVVIASDVNENLQINEGNVDTEKVLNETENSDIKELNLEKENVDNVINGFDESENTLNLDKKIDDNDKVSEQIKELLNMSNITDVNQLSSRITDIQMENLIASLKYNNLLKNHKFSSKDSGIWIDKDSRDLITNFINNHSSYTYSVNKEGYLVCDEVLRENKNLDLYKPQESDVDIGIKNVLEENKSIIIKISDIYYTFDNNNQTKLINFDDNSYSKAYEFNNIRVILLNNKYYNKENIEYNLPLSDNFLKILDNIQYKVLIGEIELGQDEIVNSNGLKSGSFSDNGQALGNAKISQIVYAGPNDDGNTYCTVGSISNGETVAILGAEGDYYHILYAVANDKEKTGYARKTNINKPLFATIQDEVMIGGYKYANGSQIIQSRGLYSKAVLYGSVSDMEGVTLLYSYNITDGSETYSVGFVEYGTGNGMKRGYIKMSYLNSPSFNSTLAYASLSTTTYTGPDSSKFNIGTGAIGPNEYVCVLGYTGDYIFIEYNTKNGRKRAFCNKSNIGVSDSSSLGVTHLPTLQLNQGYLSNQSQSVGAGPGELYSLYAYVGTIGKKESVYRQVETGTSPYNQFGYTFIAYHVGISYKGGFVPSSTLTRGQNPSIPSVPNSVGQTGGFQQAFYWETGLGGPIYAYKIGTGNKKLYLVFAQHGFEDEDYGDGVELTEIAYNFMDYMYENRNNTTYQNLLTNWTIYVIPYLNRDGIVSGYTENGPGRCTVIKKIDMNRNWPTNYYVNVLNSSRNYTGTNQLDTVEAQGLRDVLTNDNAKPVSGYNSILLDIHGWDCEAIGDEGVGDYYYKQFKNDSSTSFQSHSGTHAFKTRPLSASGASGYLAQWAIENGINKSVLLELPSHYNRVTGSRTISERFNTATINLLQGE